MLRAGGARPCACGGVSAVCRVPGWLRAWGEVQGSVWGGVGSRQGVSSGGAHKTQEPPCQI